MEAVRRFRPIRDSLEVYWQIYAGLAALVGLVIICGIGHHYYHVNRIQPISSWPETTAVIKSSWITERDSGGETSMSTTIFADLELTYVANGQEVTSRLTKLWTRTTPLNYKELLAAGKSISIRYDPKNVKVAALYPMVQE